MPDDWIRKYEQEAEKRRKEKELFNKRRQDKILALENAISSHLRPLVHRLSGADTGEWKVTDWADSHTGQPERLYCQITRSESPRGGRVFFIRFETLVDADSIDLRFNVSNGDLELLHFHYSFPISYKIVEDDVREWFGFMLGESKKPWKAGRKFRSRKR